MSHPASIDTLVIVHPDSALRGPSTKLSMQWSLADSWSGPVFILEGGSGAQGLTGSANAYLAVLDEIVDARESRGLPCRLPAADEEGLIEAACARIAETTPMGAHITLTGAWADGCVAAAAGWFNAAGYEVSIDASAIWPDDVDEAADREMQARLKTLMDQIKS